MAERVFIRGLKPARFGFSDVLDHLKAGKEVIVIEYARDKTPLNAYCMTKLPDDVAKDLFNNEPCLNIPKPPSLDDLPPLPSGLPVVG